MALSAYGDKLIVEGNIRTKITDWTMGYVVADTQHITPQSYLAKLAGDDYWVLNCIAQKESGWKMIWNYMNPTGDPNSKWSAYGYFQILKTTARHIDPKLDRMDQWENIELAVKLYQEQGSDPWLVAPQCMASGREFAKKQTP